MDELYDKLISFDPTSVIWLSISTVIKFIPTNCKATFLSLSKTKKELATRPTKGTLVILLQGGEVVETFFA